jgi:sugar-specific transcriptional regulator TrmB
MSKKEVHPYLDKLVTLGFTKAESAIYIHLLERGVEAGVAKIALGARMHRQQVYITLPKLVEMGVVDEILVAGIKKYRARPPKSIERVMERKVSVAEAVVTDLEKISKLAHDQDFEVIVGVDACRAYEVRRAQSMEVGEKQYIIGTEDDDYLNMMGSVYASLYVPILAKKKIESYYLAPKVQEARASIMDERQIFHVRVLEKLTLGPIATVIQGDTVGFYVNVHPSSVYVIKSKKVAQGHQDFFMMLWELAGT